VSSNSIILGKDENHPLIEIRTAENLNNSSYQKISNTQNLKSFASVAIQAAPALLTQAKVATSSIMEVVINGNLAQAADGDGLRAFSRAANGKFTEHARLYHADSLSNLVNAAAVWQIASVVVAQKHLADINKKLDDLKNSIDKIQNFQQVERQTKVHAISNFLKEKVSLIMSGVNFEDDKALVLELNDYYVKLDQIFLHLKDDVSKCGLKKIEHKEMFGSAEFKRDMDEKITEILKYIDLAYLCLNLKSTNISLIDYIGGNDDLVTYRFNEIKNEIDGLHNLVQKIKDSIILEIGNLNSFVNKAQSSVKNNMGAVTVGSALGGPIGIIVTKKLLSKGEKSNLLEDRKKEMMHSINRCIAFSIEKSEYSKNLANTTIHKLMETAQPIKLAFQKIDENHVLCLNTNEKIAI